MHSIRHNYCISVIPAVFLFFSSTVAALNLEPSAGVGMEYTNNATFAADNESDDLIAVTVVGASLDAGSGPSYLNATTSLKYQDYTKDTFSDEAYFNLGAIAGWEMFKDRLEWTVQDFFSQRPINSLDPGIPSNIQNTNVFTFGADIYFPISGRQSVALIPEYQKYAYQVQNTDNQSNSLDARWDYQLYRTMKVSLIGGVRDVDYDKVFIPDNKFINIHLSLSGISSRSKYSAKLGSTRVDREGRDSERATTGDMSWLLDLTGYSNIRAFIASNLTDTSSGLLNSATNPGNRDFSNVQIAAGTYRDNVINLTYSRDNVALKFNIWTELSKQDYEIALLDRDVRVIGMQLDYPVTAVFSTGMHTSYNRTDLTDFGRRDKQYSVGSNITYRLSRRLRLAADLKYQERSSTDNTVNYSETSLFVGLDYGYGELPKPTRSSPSF